MKLTSTGTERSLQGWDINHGGEVEWVPWGEGGARAKILGVADGYVLALVEADAGYRGTPHEHAHAEFLYLIDGDVTNQGTAMTAGDGYAAAAGSATTTSRPTRRRATSASSSYELTEMTTGAQWHRASMAHGAAKRWERAALKTVSRTTTEPPNHAPERRDPTGSHRAPIRMTRSLQGENRRRKRGTTAARQICPTLTTV